MAPGVRDFARYVVADTFLGTWLRNHILRAESVREFSFVTRQATIAGLSRLDQEELRSSLGPTPDVDTLFVLGSGASVEELTSAHFSEIASQRSVGINTWPVHTFVPDIFSFESVPTAGDGQDFARNLSYLHRGDIIEKGPTVLILRPKTGEELGHLSAIPETLGQSTYLYGRVTPVTRRLSTLQKDIDYFFDHIAPTTPGILFDSGASVARMIALGIVMGFRRIVLVGVDLNGSGYFWEKNPAHLAGLSGPQPRNNQQGVAHETTLTQNRPFSVVSMVAALDTYLRTNFGGEISIATNNSALTGLLAPTQWRE